MPSRQLIAVAGTIAALSIATACSTPPTVPAAAATPFTGMPTAGAGLNGWNWGPNKSPFGDWPYATQVREVMKTNPKFRVFVGNGYYDTQTTIGAMDYLVSQAGWPMNRVRTSYYQGGHLFYTVEASLKKLSDDVRAMVTRQW